MGLFKFHQLFLQQANIVKADCQRSLWHSVEQNMQVTTEVTA